MGSFLETYNDPFQKKAASQPCPQGLTLETRLGRVHSLLSPDGALYIDAK